MSVLSEIFRIYLNERKGVGISEMVNDQIYRK